MVLLSLTLKFLLWHGELSFYMRGGTGMKRSLPCYSPLPCWLLQNATMYLSLMQMEKPSRETFWRSSWCRDRSFPYLGFSGICKLPKWDPGSRAGICLGHSIVHANSVALVFNPNTGDVSPQFLFFLTITLSLYHTWGMVPCPQTGLIWLSGGPRKSY